jgi:hypothetical protein
LYIFSPGKAMITMNSVMKFCIDDVSGNIQLTFKTGVDND